MTEWRVIQDVFPNAIVLLCTFHCQGRIFLNREWDSAPSSEIIYLRMDHIFCHLCDNFKILSEIVILNPGFWTTSHNFNRIHRSVPRFAIQIRCQILCSKFHSSWHILEVIPKSHFLRNYIISHNFNQKSLFRTKLRIFTANPTWIYTPLFVWNGCNKSSTLVTSALKTMSFCTQPSEV